MKLVDLLKPSKKMNKKSSSNVDGTSDYHESASPGDHMISNASSNFGD